MLEDVIAGIRAFHRDRVYAMEGRKSCDLRLGSYLRFALGWRRDLPDADRKRIAKGADDLILCGEKIAAGKQHELSDTEEFIRFKNVILASIASRAPMDMVETDAVKAMEKLAEQLPVWATFGEPIRGFGLKSLATIVGEAGDLSNYGNPAKLWKRMGVGIVGNIRQGGLSKTASNEAWIEHGYNRERRSRMWNIGKALIYAGGPYADLYRARKETERQKAAAEGLTVAPAASIPKKRASEFRSLGHIDKRAQRYMEKRLLRDLWSAWRRAERQLHPEERVPPAPPSADEAERSATYAMSSTVALPSASIPADEAGPTTINRVPSMPLVSSAAIPAKAGKRRARHSAQPKITLPAASSLIDVEFDRAPPVGREAF